MNLEQKDTIITWLYSAAMITGVLFFIAAPFFLSETAMDVYLMFLVVLVIMQLICIIWAMWDEGRKKPNP